MYGSRVRWALVLLAIFVLLILSIWGIFSIAKNLFRSSSDSTAEADTRITLDQEYNHPGTSVTFELQGPVVADSEFLSYKITVGRTERVLQVIRGYDGRIEKEQRYDNNEDAYAVFLRALDGASFKSKNRSTLEDERGACPLGRRYVYSVNDSGEQVFRSWNASCSRDLGTSEAGVLVRSLFQKQIPDYNELLTNTGLK